jgi:hypothetical protein
MPNTTAAGPPRRSPSRSRLVRRVSVGATIGVGLTALATAGLAGTAGTAVAGDDDHVVSYADGFGTRTIVLDGPAGISATPTASPPAPTASPPAPGTVPSMRLQMAYQRVGKELTLTITLDGYVYEPLDAANKPLVYPKVAKASIGMGTELLWGDGQSAATTNTAGHCGKPQNLHQLKDTFTVKHTYKKAGTYNVAYTFKACGLVNGKIGASLPVKVT